MAEEQDSQEKTEEPTPRKIQKSLEDGQFLTSKEMFIFTSIFVGLLIMMFLTSMFPYFHSLFWMRMFFIVIPSPNSIS